MGMYDANMKHVHDRVRDLTRREEKWRVQEEKALEALQWCEALNDTTGMERLCAVFERTGGMESPAIHKNLKRIFDDVAAPAGKDVLRLQALTCLNRTDWGRATDDFLSSTPERDDGLEFSMPFWDMCKAMFGDDRNLHDTVGQFLLTAGMRPDCAEAALETLNNVAANPHIPVSLRRDAERRAELLKNAQTGRLQGLVTSLEKDAYIPRPRLV